MIRMSKSLRMAAYGFVAASIYASSMCAFPLLAAPAAAEQQAGRGIAVVVNNSVITQRDLEMRAKLALLSSRIPDTPANRKRMKDLVLRKLVDEHLQLQEAKRRGIQVSDAEVAQGIVTIEQQSGMPRGGLQSVLQRSGVDIGTIKDQVRADIAWVKVVRQYLAPRVRISEQEVDVRFKQLAGPVSDVEFAVSEIFIGADEDGGMNAARTQAQNVLDQVRSGKPFAAIARQFSQSVSASKGGDLGWVRESVLQSDLDKALRRLKPGQISNLIEADNGYYILQLRERRGGTVAVQAKAPPKTAVRRRVVMPDPAKVSITFAQLVFPFPANATDEQKKKVQANAAKVRGSLGSCGDVERIAASMSLPQSGNMGTLKASDLAAPVRSILVPMKAGQSTPPLNRGDAAVILMVCDRSGPVAQTVEEEVQVASAPAPQPVSREAVSRRLEDEKLDVEARRLLRDLRRAAFVDNRR